MARKKKKEQKRQRKLDKGTNKPEETSDQSQDAKIQWAIRTNYVSSLMKINEELKKEIKERTRADKEEPEQVSRRLRERIKELNCLYDISSFGASTDFSLDAILQAVIDFIPPAFQ